MTTKTVHVAVGVVKNFQGEILLSKRAKHLHQGGLWEFPGGKVEQDESVFDALVREFQEEVNITITQAEPFMTIHHDYGDKQVLLDVWISTHFNGDARSNEDQLIAWVAPEKLSDYEFPKANQAIIEKLMVNTAC
jgi:8-oxo-dGTP diphosphatase